MKYWGFWGMWMFIKAYINGGIWQIRDIKKER